MRNQVNTNLKNAVKLAEIVLNQGFRRAADMIRRNKRI